MRTPGPLLACLLAASSSTIVRGSSGLRMASSLLGLKGGCSPPSKTDDDFETSSFTKLSEEIAFAGKYRQVKSIKYRYPNSKVVNFDILTQGGHGSVVVVAWDVNRKTATLIREFHPGVGRMQFGTVAGMFETSKHSTPQECASMELEEEAHLRASSERWIPLLDNGKTMSFEKYSDNTFSAFLVLDPEIVSNPKKLDEEEFIIIEKGISHKEIMRLIRSCQINVVSSYALMLAFAKLDEMGIDYK